MFRINLGQTQQELHLMQEEGGFVVDDLAIVTAQGQVGGIEISDREITIYLQDAKKLWLRENKVCPLAGIAEFLTHYLPSLDIRGEIPISVIVPENFVVMESTPQKFDEYTANSANYTFIITVAEDAGKLPFYYEGGETNIINLLTDLHQEDMPFSEILPIDLALREYHSQMVGWHFISLLTGELPDSISTHHQRKAYDWFCFKNQDLPTTYVNEGSAKAIDKVFSTLFHKIYLEDNDNIAMGAMGKVARELDAVDKQIWEIHNSILSTAKKYRRTTEFSNAEYNVTLLILEALLAIAPEAKKIYDTLTQMLHNEKNVDEQTARTLMLRKLAAELNF